MFPIHNYLIPYSDPTSARRKFDYEGVTFVLKEMLRIAPECARQRNEEGSLLLYVVANDEWGPDMDSDRRLEIVQKVFEAYPQAALEADPKHTVPPFVLPIVHLADSLSNNETEERAISGLNATYFLLRQCPEMIESALKNCPLEERGADGPGSKRIKIE